MLDGIVMNIIDVPVQICFIAYLMFPEASLPYTAFPFCLPRRALARLRTACLKIPTSKSFFDQQPPLRKVVVAFRQAPQTMQMVRQEAERHNLERPLPLNTSPRAPQADPRKIIHKKWSALVCHHREKIIAAAESRSSVIRHVNPGDTSNDDFSAWATSCPSYSASLHSCVAYPRLCFLSYPLSHRRPNTIGPFMYFQTGFAGICGVDYGMVLS